MSEGTMRLEVRAGAYVASREAHHVLETSSLGSCVAVALYDARARVAGLCHAPLDRRARFPASTPVGDCADSAILALVEAMVALGAEPSRMVATVAGAANMFPAAEVPVYDVGRWNLAAAKETLCLLGIPVVRADVGGAVARRLRIDVACGTSRIRRAGEAWERGG